jgi:hypothetical protein
MPRLRMYKHTRKGRKARRTKRRTQYKKTGFKTKVKKALMSMSETKSVGRAFDTSVTLGNTSNTWNWAWSVFPANGDANMLINEGTGPNERIGNRISLIGVRIPMYLLNQTPEALRIRIIVVKQKTNLPTTGGNEFINPLGNAEPFDAGHPWQADWPYNKEYGFVVKQRTFTLGGSIDWGAGTAGFPGHRPIQFTGNTGIKRLEMGFSLKSKKHYFDQHGGETRNIDQYVQYLYVWRLTQDTIPYELNHNLQALGNFQIKQFHKVYFKDV